MPNDLDQPSEPAIAPASAPRRGFVRRNWGKLTVGGIVIIPVIAFTIWAGIALSFTYSSGDRIGHVQNLAKTGWLCKTWEGELQLLSPAGTVPAIFHFSVRDDSVARAIQRTEGRQVSLRYEQHVGVPTSCFGDTEYFVTGVKETTPAP